MCIPMLASPTPHCSQCSFQWSIVLFDFHGGWCMIGDAIYALNAMLFGPGVYEVVSEVSPVV